MVICLERGADLHMAQLMPLSLTVSCFSKIQIGFTFLVPAHPGSLGKRADKRVCVLASVSLYPKTLLPAVQLMIFFAIAIKYYAILVTLSLLLSLIRNNLCINTLKHFHHILTVLSPYLVELDTFEIIENSINARLNCFGDNFVSRAPIFLLFFSFL